MRSICITILSLFSLLSDSFSQDYSTWGEIYDYEVGDIFHIEESEEQVSFYWLDRIVNIEIVEKNISNNLDTITYKKLIKTYTVSSIGNGYDSYHQMQTVVYPDSLCIVDSVYYSSYYNQRKISYIDNSFGLIDSLQVMLMDVVLRAIITLT
ncbi:MAG: hypothetical protein U9R60_11340 [Bacteroidota bacterium]|nr:hypothetical protein [Bacteroidota bacterium]